RSNLLHQDESLFSAVVRVGYVEVAGGRGVVLAEALDPCVGADRGGEPADVAEVRRIHDDEVVEALDIFFGDRPGPSGQLDPPAPRDLDRPRVGGVALVVIGCPGGIYLEGVVEPGLADQPAKD